MVISWIAVVSRPHPEHWKVGLVRTSTMSTRERWPASIGSTRSPRFTAYPSHPTSRLVQSARGKVLPPSLGSVLSARAQGYRWGTLPSTYPATPVLPDEPYFFHWLPMFFLSGTSTSERGPLDVKIRKVIHCYYNE